jgi:hypothetical protein
MNIKRAKTFTMHGNYLYIKTNRHLPDRKWLQYPTVAKCNHTTTMLHWLQLPSSTIAAFVEDRSLKNKVTQKAELF